LLRLPFRNRTPVEGPFVMPTDLPHDHPLIVSRFVTPGSCTGR